MIKCNEHISKRSKWQKDTTDTGDTVDLEDPKWQCFLKLLSLDNCIA